MNPEDLIALLTKAMNDEVERTGVSLQVVEEAGVHICNRLRAGFREDRLLAPLLAAALHESRRLAVVQ